MSHGSRDPGRRGAQLAWWQQPSTDSSEWETESEGEELEEEQ